MAALPSHAALPPGPAYPRPLQTLGWIKRPGPWMQRLRARYGDTFTVRIAQEGTWVFLSDPDDLKEVFRGDPKVFHAGEANRVLRPILGPRSVLLLDDEAHIAQRRLLLPPFHGERMQAYGEIMRDVAEREIASWPRREPFALWPRMQAITLEIVMRTIFGVRESERLAQLGNVLARALDDLTTTAPMALMALLGPDRISRLGAFRRRVDPVDAAVLEVIREARAHGGEERDDVLALLLSARHEDGTPMEDRELRDELMTLLVTGHETTATSLAWAMERLLRHPVAWERLRAEATSDGGDSTYADAVTKETLRLRPVLPLVVRRLTAPATVGGREYPAGVTLAPCIYLVHRRADVYPEPHAFRPERFLEQPAGTYTWIPFGGGVRRCLGASFAQFEMSVVLHALARHAPLEPAARDGERVRRRAITLTPARGAEVVAA